MRGSYLHLSDCVIAHYNQAAETELKVDASPVGLGATLLQRSGDSVRPVAYASRKLRGATLRLKRRRWRLSGSVNVSILTYMTNYKEGLRCINNVWPCSTCSLERIE